MTKSESTELLCSELLLANDELKNELICTKESTNAQLLETTQVSKQLEHRIKSLQQQLANQELKLTNQEQQIEHWQESQGQDKLYSRAFKLAEKGADIDEIIIECELPRAEAEMLLSVYRQRNNT
jgi:TolA-binding protein